MILMIAYTMYYKVNTGVSNSTKHGINNLMVKLVIHNYFYIVRRSGLQNSCYSDGGNG